MKTISLVFCTTLLFCVPAFAQQPPVLPAPTPKTIKPVTENYVVNLTMTDKEQKATELSLVVAAPDFRTSFPDAKSNITTFQGTLTPEDADTLSFSYVLGGEIAVSTSSNSPNGFTNVQYKSVATQSTVRLKLGEPVQILKSDLYTYTLKVSRLSDAQGKGK